MGDFVDQVNYAEHTWDKEYELILVDRGDKAKCMGWLCTHTSNYYDKQRRMLLVPASAVSWFLNVFGMFATYLGKEKISEPLVILIVSLGNFIVATLTTIAEQGKAGDKVELFNQTSRDYNLIASEINHQIRLPPCNRKPVMKVLIDTEKRYNDLIKSTPNIPEPITKDFTQRNYRHPSFNEMAKPEGMINLTSCRQNLYQENDYIMSETPSDIKIYNKKNNNMDIIDIEDEDENIIINRNRNNTIIKNAMNNFNITNNDSSDSDNDNDAYTL
jgi:hypothetical protein